MSFVMEAIKDHKASEDYQIAKDAELYLKHRNPTIMRFQKFIRDAFGRSVPDVWSANNKIASNWYSYFTVQGVQYLLGNGVTFGNVDTKKKLGKNFDKRVQDAAKAAKNGGVAFGFWNHDHLEVFPFTGFVPLWDEEDGSLKAGIRFWQIDDDKPIRATLYELDGFTHYIQRIGDDVSVYQDKRPYRANTATSEADGERIIEWYNYPSFPIVPLWNIEKQSDLVGNQGTIDAYDLMSSKLINNVSDGEFIYWVIKNAGGMANSDVEFAKFVERINVVRAVAVDGDDGVDVNAHTVEIPFEASKAALDQLERQLFKDFMALRVDDISANATNDQIQAAYEPINQKTDEFEYGVTEFIQGILALAGIDDEPAYTRSQLSNRAETIDSVISSAEYLDREYVLEKVMTALGDADNVEDAIKRKHEQDATIMEQLEVNEDDAIE